MSTFCRIFNIVKERELTTKHPFFMTLSDIRPFFIFSQDQDIDFREILENLSTEEVDFEVDNFRFIEKDSIDKIQQEELTNDLYLLGCFNASFLAEVTNLPLKLIEAAQKGEEYTALGEALEPHVEDIQAEYSRLDGYGHHFAHYDHNEHEIGNFYAFKIN